jgi:hypothetical protein
VTEQNKSTGLNVYRKSHKGLNSFHYKLGASMKECEPEVFSTFGTSFEDLLI